MNNISGLVIDDNEDFVEVTSQFLELKGFNIVGKGYNGCQAANLYKEHNPNFVVLDMKMPQYDGSYAIKEIKKINSKAKIFVITGYSDHKNLENEVDAVFSKPCDMKQLSKTIESSCFV